MKPRIFLSAQAEPVMLTDAELETLAALIAKSRGGHVFVWRAEDPLPIFDPQPTSRIQ
jgi:hypothetical protein